MLKVFLNGLIKENPVFILLLGMCATLAVTTSAVNAIGMGLSTTFVLACSNIVISALRKVIPDEIRIASFVVIIAGFVTIVEMLLKAFLPAISDALGLFLPLIVVNCIILARAEAFASKNGIIASAMDGLGMGLGFTLALFILASIREILGNGTFFGMSVFGEGYMPATILILPPGGFFMLAFVLAAVGVITKKAEKRGKKNV